MTRSKSQSQRKSETVAAPSSVCLEASRPRSVQSAHLCRSDHFLGDHLAFQFLNVVSTCLQHIMFRYLLGCQCMYTEHLNSFSMPFSPSLDSGPLPIYKKKKNLLACFLLAVFYFALYLPFGFFYKRNHMTFNSVCLIPFTQHHGLKVHLLSFQWLGFLYVFILT